MSLFANDPITELEPQTKAKLRSTQILTSLPQLISELIQNSLDAGASHIEVGIDPAEWECWVRDDGQGMSMEGMRLLTLGHEKGRYNSSKTYESQTEAGTFGFRGEALASAMELSCLEISSRTPNARESWSVILKASWPEIGSEKLYSGPSVRWRREKAGTTIVCRDVFFNVPVRRKSHPNTVRTLELTRKELENLALVFPQVSFTLEHTNELQKTRVLSISKTSSSLAAFRALYGRAMVEAFQSFYINRHPMAFGEIQRAIEQKFSFSRFGRLAQGGDEYDLHLPSRVLRSPKKADRKPVYVLNLSVSPEQVDNFLEPAKSRDTSRVLSFVLEVIHRFLSRNGFASTTPRLTGIEAEPTEQPSRLPRKRIRREPFEPDSGDESLAPKSSRNTQEPIVLGTELRESCWDHQTGDDKLCIHDDSGYFEWVDPSTGESFSIDSQTGNSLPKHRPLDQTQTANNDPSEVLSTSYLDRRWLNKGGSSALGASSSKTEVPTWLANALKRNNTFAFPEKGVFSTKTANSKTSSDHHRLTSHAHILGDHWASSLTQSSQSISKSFSRTDLHNSEVIAQVDTKFIACVFRITAASERILVLVDQHAADERVRVERYLKKICIGFIQDAVEVFQLDSPSKILLARREAEILARPDSLNALSRWGLCVKIHVPGAPDGQNSIEEHDFCQAEVLFVPDVVSKRLIDRRELSDFVKAMATAIDVEGCSHWPLPSALGNEDGDWVKALRFCPLPLFELVNSRACRGAIMFNDPLDRHQCQRLITQLGETVFPFQCAHGRPSIAPLLRLDHIPPTTPINWQAFDERL